MGPGITQFWVKYPALLYACGALLGSALALNILWMPFFCACLVILAISIQTSYVRICLTIVLGICSFCLTKERYQFPTEYPLPINGTASIEIHSITHSKTPFGEIWKYKGTLLGFIPQGTQNSIARNIPLNVIIPHVKGTQRPLATHIYRIQGRLKDNGKGQYAFTPTKNRPWESLENHPNLAEWRFSAKRSLQQYIRGMIEDPHVSSFLSGIATGDFDDRILSFELGRFGLQHLMAISGLHFSIIATIFAFFLGLFIPRTACALVVIGLLNAYFIFLGNTPSVMRAWISIAITLSALVVERRSLALNSLGIALLVVILLDPLLMRHLGFQFSFGITAVILLWFQPCDTLLQKFFLKRPLSQVIHIGVLDQHGYCLMTFLRQALALSLAVNLVAFPLTLYHFHKFPVMSLLYNLFFPFMVSLSMLLLILALITSPISFVSQMIHSVNEAYTQFLLNFALNFPKSMEFTFYTQFITTELLLGYLFMVFSLGIIAHEYTKRPDDLIFI